MKKEEINFIQKNRIGSRIEDSGITIRNSSNKVAITIYNSALTNHSLRIGFISNRVYFEISEKGYKPLKVHSYNTVSKIVVSGKNAELLRPFVRYEWYQLKYDDECEMYYIEGE